MSTPPSSPAMSVHGERRNEVAVTYPDGGRWVDHARYLDARDELRNEVARVNLARIYDLGNKFAVRTRFKERLEDPQSEDTFVVRNGTDWDAIVLRMNDEVHEYDFMSVAFAGPRDGSRNPLVLVSSFVGTTAIFDVPAVRRCHPTAVGKGSEGQEIIANVRYPLPWEVEQWLYHPSIVVAGTNIRNDVRRYLDLDTSNMIDFGAVFDHFTRPFPRCNGPLIRLGGIRGRTDVGVQNLYSKGEETECLPEDVYIARYGPYAYLSSVLSNTSRFSCIGRHGPHRYGKWPWFRNSKELFEKMWMGSDELYSSALWYVYHLSTAPQSLVCKLLLDRVIRSGWPYRNMTMSAIVKSFLVPFKKIVCDFPEDLDTSASEHEDDEYGCVIDRYVRPTDSALPEVHQAIFSYPDSPRVAPQPGTSGTSQRSRTSPRPVPSSSAGGAVPVIELDSDTDSPSPVRRSPFQDSNASSDTFHFEGVILPPLTIPCASIAREIRPSFRPGCTCCGDIAHSFTAFVGSRVQVLCPVYVLADGRPICSFEDCSDKKSHLVQCCTDMHATCTRCYTRGHTEEAGCTGWSDATWEWRRIRWEISADRGMYTRHRRQDPAYGYFSPRPCTPWPLPFSSYDYVRTFPAGTMRRLIDDYALSGEWPPMANEQRPVYGVVTLGGASKRISSQPEQTLDSHTLVQQAPAAVPSDSVGVESNGHGRKETTADGVTGPHETGQDTTSSSSDASAARAASEPAISATRSQASDQPLRRSLRNRTPARGSEEADDVDGQSPGAPRKRIDKRSPPSQENKKKKKQARTGPDSQSSSA